MKVALIAVLLAAAPVALAQAPAPPKPGHYCLRTDIGAGESDEQEVVDSLQKLDGGLDNRRVRLGKLGVDLDLIEEGGRTLAAFSNYMPDNGQIVRSTAPSPTRRESDGALSFAFTDNWRAPGRGVVRPEGDGVVLTIVRTKTADTFAGQYSDRQFGEFKLNPGTCPPYR